MKTDQKKSLNEDIIINNYLSKLNFNKKGTFKFKNDAAYLEFYKNKKVVVTTDSISENIDFFKYDEPESIAKKITTINLSDLSAMGANPRAYTLSIFFPSYLDVNWISKFTKELLKIQRKYNFYLLGGDLSRSNKLQISATFFGSPKFNIVVPQNITKVDNDIWLTGEIGDSFVGLQILKNKINIKDKKLKNYFLDKYYYPKPCMLGSKINNYVSSMKDVSDGFIGDLKKMIINKHGAYININNFPISLNLRKIIRSKIISIKYILNSGDNYNLICIAKDTDRKKILNIAKKNNVKITLVGKILNNSKILFDSDYTLNIPKEFDHFL